MRKIPTTKAEALALLSRRQHNIEVGNEDHLQVDCVKAFANKYPEKRGRLFATFQNPDKSQVNIWLAKGLVAGVSDLIYITDDFHLVGIELKHPAKSHSKEHVFRQCNWLLSNCYLGCFCNSVEMFMQIIEGNSTGIDPKKIMEKYSNKSTVYFI